MTMKKNIFLLLAALCVLAAFTACDNASEIVTEEYIKEKVDTSDNNQGGDQGGGQGIENYQAVDLGLSVKWANKNYGAGSRWNVGYYMTFGCIDPNDLSAKKPDTGGDNIAGTKLDVATMQLGSGWVIPNREQLKELCDECSWKSSTQNNVSGFQVTGPNGNSIFIPLSGYMPSYSNSFYDTEYAYLMSSEYSYYSYGSSIRPYYLKVYENDGFLVVFNSGSSDFPRGSYRMPIRPIYTK